MMKRLSLLLLVSLWVIVACQPQETEIAVEPTQTLLPIVSQTPRVTATPVPSWTPLPTYTPSPTETTEPPTPTIEPTPTLTPTLQGIVQSLQRVNVRVGPGTEYDFLTSLPPGTGVIIIASNPDNTWYNIRLEDGREGWMSAGLLFLPDTPTPFPTATPSPDLTAIALGTPLPTAIIGGGTVTPTPPSAVRTATPADAEATEEITDDDDPDGDGTPGAVNPQTLGLVPTVDIASINLTATALVRGAATATATDEPRQITVEPVETAETNTPDPDATAQPTQDEPGEPRPLAEVRNPSNPDVFAFCSAPRYGISPPSNLREGQSIDIWWGWFARTEQQVQDHIDNAVVELRANGELIEGVNQYRSVIVPAQDGTYVAYWYVPYGPLESGEYEITYTVSWQRQITDGFDFFGPDTSIPFEQEACVFTVP